MRRYAQGTDDGQTIYDELRAIGMGAIVSGGTKLLSAGGA